jgi:large subunit ribosomal protein L10
MSDENKKVSANRVKKEQIVAGLNDKIGKSKAIVFTNYQGLTHKQLEGLKKAIKPMQAEFVVAKNSLVLRALDTNKIKVSDQKQFEGPTGTLLIYEDIVGPLKELAKLIKELGIPNVKFGIMDSQNLTGDQVLKISTLPSKEVLLTQIVMGLKSPISGLHRALNWNLQKFVMTLGAIAASKPAAQAEVSSEPVKEPEVSQEPAPVEEVVAEQVPEEPKEAEKPSDENNEEVKNEGGEN